MGLAGVFMAWIDLSLLQIKGRWGRGRGRSRPTGLPICLKKIAGLCKANYQNLPIGQPRPGRMGQVSSQAMPWGGWNSR